MKDRVLGLQNKLEELQRAAEGPTHKERARLPTDSQKLLTDSELKHVLMHKETNSSQIREK